MWSDNGTGTGTGTGTGSGTGSGTGTGKFSVNNIVFEVMQHVDIINTVKINVIMVLKEVKMG